MTDVARSAVDAPLSGDPDLLRDERRETAALLSLAAPAGLIITMVLFVPIAWMAWMSLRNEMGWTLEHYAQLQNPTNLKHLVTTFRIALIVAALAVLIGFPTSYAISLLPRRLAGFCMLLVLMPFFTSMLVRTYAWMLLLQRRGLINTMLMDWGIIERPIRLVYNETGTIVGMLHIMLPFAIMPIYAALRSIDWSLPAAAMTLGASPTKAFRSVTLPLAMPGIAAGALIVFTLSLGFYVTPAILGGGRVMNWPMLVETVMLYNPQWGAASALGMVLLVLTLIIVGFGRRLLARGLIGGAAGR